MATYVNLDTDSEQKNGPAAPKKLTTDETIEKKRTEADDTIARYETDETVETKRTETDKKIALYEELLKQIQESYQLPIPSETITPHKSEKAKESELPYKDKKSGSNTSKKLQDNSP